MEPNRVKTSDAAAVVRSQGGVARLPVRRAPGRPRRRRGWFVRRALLGADVGGFVAAFLVAEALMRLRGGWPVNVPREALYFGAGLPLFVLFAKVYGLYDQDDAQTNHTTVDEFVGIFHLCSVGVWLLFAGAWMTGLAYPPLEKLFYFWITAVVFVPVARSLSRVLVRRSSRYEQRAIVVGAGDVGRLVARKLRQHREYGIRLVGLVDGDPLEAGAEAEGFEILGTLDDLPELVERLEIDRVVIGFSRDSHEQLLAAARALNDLDVQIDVVPRLFELIAPSVAIRTLEALPLVGLPPRRPARSSRLLKRAVDVVGASVSLVLMAPLMLYIALRVRFDSPGPILFRQERVGRDMERFTVLKFRTMRTDVDQDVHRAYIRRTMDSRSAPTANGIYKLDRSDAVTPFGRWLRKTSLDELPQLLNVLRGDMSLVGPRPCIAYELENFEPHHFDRFLVRPGITGLWQVTARAHATFGEALDIDVGYVRGWSLGLDLWLLFRTPLEVLRGRIATA